MHYRMDFKNCKIDLQSVLAHADIPWNEFSDHLARSIHNSTPFFPFLVHTDILSHLRQIQLKSWMYYPESNIGQRSAYSRIQPILPAKGAVKSIFLSRFPQ